MHIDTNNLFYILKILQIFHIVNIYMDLVLVISKSNNYDLGYCLGTYKVTLFDF